MSDAITTLLADPPGLPVVAGLADVRTGIAEHGALVLQAPPGSGKTTLVPPVVADVVPGRVIVTAPRRIAARAAASRLASLLGEQVGETVGYAVRGDRRVAPATRIEFVTDGLLLRRLQRDPDLPGVAAVVLDEVHERRVDGDLTLALLVDVRAHLRPDLPVVAMSATVEAERTAALLGKGTPVITVPGSLHPVDRLWAPAPSGVLPVDERGVPPSFLDHVTSVVRRALQEQPGDVLAFLPGAGEVDQVVRRIGQSSGLDVLPLHGRLPAAEQDRALRPSPDGRRRVVVSTAVAESSLTVPGVRTVVDAGLVRRPQIDRRRGLSGLVTVRVSKAAADQRAGRAGREAPGAVYRCWSESDHAHLDAYPAPEMATADLTGLALEIAAWGAGPEDLALLDPPPTATLDAAQQTLRALDAIGEDGAITHRGRRMVGMPLDPRLARALLDGADLVGRDRAAEVVALLAEDVRAPGGDLLAALRALRGGGSSPAAAAWRRTCKQLLAALPDGSEPAERLTDDLAVGLVVALTHPARVARLRAGSESTYLMASGTGAVLLRGSGLARTPWLAVGDVDRRPGAKDATIRAAAALTEDLALEAAASLWTEESEVVWSEGRILARAATRLGAIPLSSAPLEPSPAAVARALSEGLRSDGLDALPWTDASRLLRLRLAFLHRAIGEPWPDVSDDALIDGIDGWLGHELGRVRSAADLRRVDVLTGLRGLLPWPDASRLDELAPERVEVPSGSSVRVDYAGEQPVLAVRVQEMLGATETPRLADGRVPVLLHLLSPARRPAAVTDDLARFWTTGYPGVRADLRGRYPKHAWPEDPTTAEPTRGVRRRPAAD